MTATLGWVVAMIHLVVAAIWMGSMSYSLTVVQPKAARFFARDPARHEAFLVTLAHGNRWKVVGLIAVLLGTGAVGVLVLPGTMAVGFGIAVVSYLVAGAVFANVSWRHWPARVFAVPDELPGFQRRLRMQAWVMLCLVAAAFGTALGATVAAGVN